MEPTVGRIVHYRLTEEEAAQTNKRRQDAREQVEQMRRTRPGLQAHVGNSVSAGTTVPMLITAVWTATTVNGQAFLDGADSLWVLSAAEGDEPGQWSWPPRA